MKIKSVTGQEVLASGGYPTLQATVILDDDTTASAQVPYGASAGSHEAVMLVDNDPDRYQGKGVLKAVQNIEEIISPAILGQTAKDQAQIDKTLIDLDGTPNKSKLGGNSILAVSLAVAKATASSLKKPLYRHIIDTFQTKPNLASLPKPMMVAIEGGKHAANSTDLQEYCLSAVGTETVEKSIESVLETYHTLEKVLTNKGLSTNVGNEGAFAPEGIESNEAPLQFLTQAIEQAGFKPGADIAISIDAAANEFYQDGKYQLKIEDKALTSDELIEYYTPWLDKYPVVSLEDMLAEDDWSAWTRFNKITNAHKILHLGDDLTVTSTDRLQQAINQQAISAILIKLNQVGTLTETVECCQLANQHGLVTVPSHRGGGETNDTSMVDLAVAVGSRFIKVGPTRGERISKYNRLIEIERELK
jgi:enolase